MLFADQQFPFNVGEVSEAIKLKDQMLLRKRFAAIVETLLSPSASHHLPVVHESASTLPVRFHPH